LEGQLVILNQAPTDTYSFGTVVVFASGNGGTTKWHYVKVGEEAWKDMTLGLKTEKSLSEWVLYAREANIGYFEVYILTVAAIPIYAAP